ncbi:MAG TPA: 3-dehydroquinate synthase [Bacteroidota bacterium]|nr:3-dehydroquinate synthase [Bacteroidota bacterium]
MPRIRVRLDAPRDRSYTVEIHPGLLAEIPLLLSRTEGKKRMFVVTDENVLRLYGRAFMSRLASGGCTATLLDVPAGERSKAAGTLGRLYTKLFRGGVRRDSLVIALGGGVIGDLAGYLAATALRGVRLVQIPTTLLAQVDSSVGGKVGIDHSAGKNLIGAFHQPSAVYIDPEVLQTLPPEEFRAGLAEVIKIAAALDAPFFVQLERNAPRIRRENTQLLARIIETAVALKASVVERDERETGLRRILNLGHTVAHALEAATGYAIRHGEAVAVGMVCEARIAVALGMLAPRESARLEALLGATGLPLAPPPRINERVFLASMSLDKKAVAEGNRFVLLRRIGESAHGVTVPADLVRKTMGFAARKSTHG